MIDRLIKLYYVLTAYVPRRIPDTKAKYKEMLAVMKDCYGVELTPASKATIAGHVLSAQPTSLMRPWGHIANAAKRLEINKLAQEQRVEAVEELKKQLQDEFVATSEALASADPLLQDEVLGEHPPAECHPSQDDTQHHHPIDSQCYSHSHSEIPAVPDHDGHAG